MSSANNSKLTVAALDFDSIKAQLISYLQSQNTFTDYAFTGSAINQLLNVLAYNTHYLAFYLNMVANESNMDTAVLRPNIVSKAKMLAYVPRSATAAEATVNVVVTKLNTDPTSVLTLPAFTGFTSEPLNGVSYNFLSVDSQSSPNVNNSFTFTGVLIKEGQPISKTFTVQSASNPTQTFDLGDSNIDTSTLQVIVQTSSTSSQQNTFILAEDATLVTGNTNVYYLNQGQSGNYEIYFGDGILGTKLSDGNLVIVTYINTSGDAANSLKVFRLQTPLLSGSTTNVTTAFASAAGSQPETGDQIKFSASKSYLSQNRTVTDNDYTNLIDKKYPYFQAVNVWGGADNVPPIFGSVFISAKPLNGFAITQTQKQFVINTILMPIGVLTVTPVFVDADYNFLNFRITAYYNPKETTSTPAQMQSIIANSSQSWANSNLNKFKNTFKLSKLLRAVDNSDQSITGSVADIFIEKRIDPIISTPTTYTLSYGTSLRVGIGQNRLYSSPTFQQNDQTGVARQCYIEETPESSSGIDSISIIQPGSGYTTSPTLSIVGDGTGANAIATIVNGMIQSVKIDVSGANYTTATVLVSGGGGSGAVLQALAQGSNGILRSYYFDQNNVKTVLNANVGTIDYLNGVIVLTNFSPSDVGNPSQTLSIHIQPQSDNFGSTLNRIITLDTADPSAVSVTILVDDSN